MITLALTPGTYTVAGSRVTMRFTERGDGGISSKVTLGTLTPEGQLVFDEPIQTLTDQPSECEA